MELVRTTQYPRYHVHTCVNCQLRSNLPRTFLSIIIPYSQTTLWEFLVILNRKQCFFRNLNLQSHGFEPVRSLRRRLLQDLLWRWPRSPDSTPYPNHNQVSSESLQLEILPSEYVHLANSPHIISVFHSTSVMSFLNSALTISCSEIFRMQNPWQCCHLDRARKSVRLLVSLLITSFWWAFFQISTNPLDLLNNFQLVHPCESLVSENKKTN